MDKRFCLYIASNLLYLVSLTVLGAFFLSGTSGDAAQWRWDLLMAAGLCAFLGLMGDVVSEIADRVQELLLRSLK